MKSAKLMSAAKGVSRIYLIRSSVFFAVKYLFLREGSPRGGEGFGLLHYSGGRRMTGSAVNSAKLRNEVSVILLLPDFGGAPSSFDLL